MSNSPDMRIEPPSGIDDDVRWNSIPNLPLPVETQVCGTCLSWHVAALLPGAVSGNMAVRESDLLIDERLSIPMSELRFRYVRSSGPGGQNVNKVNSQVQLAWRVADCQSLPADVLERLVNAQQGRISKAGYLRIHCDQFRDREKNRQECLDRLKGLISAVAKAPRTRRKTKVPRRMIESRLRNKQQRSEVKQTRRRPKLDD